MFYMSGIDIQKHTLFEKVSEDIQDRGIYSRCFIYKRLWIGQGGFYFARNKSCLNIFCKNSIACLNVKKVIAIKGPSLTGGNCLYVRFDQAS